MSKKLLGFKKIEISFKLDLLSSPSIQVIHSCFAKKHSSRSDEFPLGKTLFLVNIPVDMSEGNIREMFVNYGQLEKVRINNLKRNCHLVFKDSESVDLILEEFDSYDTTCTNYTNENGLESKIYVDVEFLKSQQEPDINNLKSMVDTAMEIFHDEEMERKRALDESRNVPDEDGFVTVTRRGRKTNQDSKGGSVLALKKEDAEALKPKEHGLVDFYRFQQRERKRNELADLRRKFEQDKEKIKQMKESRKFKPY